MLMEKYMDEALSAIERAEDLTDRLSGEFKPNLETVACSFFGPDEIPSPLAENKTTAAQIAMCFRAAADENWNVEFD